MSLTTKLKQIAADRTRTLDEAKATYAEILRRWDNPADGDAEAFSAITDALNIAESDWESDLKSLAEISQIESTIQELPTQEEYDGQQGEVLNRARELFATSIANAVRKMDMQELKEFLLKIGLVTAIYSFEDESRTLSLSSPKNTDGRNHSRRQRIQEIKQSHPRLFAVKPVVQPAPAEPAPAEMEFAAE